MKKTVIIFVALIILSLAGCGSTQHDSIYNNDTALAGEDRYSETAFSGKSTGAYIYYFTVSSISGADTIWTYESSDGGEEVTLDCSLLEGNNGDAKLVLIDPSDNVTTLIEVTSSINQADYTFTAEQGTYRIKVVGKNQAKVECQLEYSHGAI